jgi:hypothetical protein
MCSIDLEPWRAHSERRVRARKTYECESCYGLIAPGVEYIRHFSISADGDISVEKMCVPCDTAMTEFANHDGHMSTSPSYFPELVRECIDYYDEESRAWIPMYEAIVARGTEGNRRGALPPPPEVD